MILFVYRKDFDVLKPLIIIGPIVVIAAICLLAFSIELLVRLRKQIKRVMDPNLLKTDNFHEVKHWVEPGT